MKNKLKKFSFLLLLLPVLLFQSNVYSQTVDIDFDYVATGSSLDIMCTWIIHNGHSFTINSTDTPFQLNFGPSGKIILNGGALSLNGTERNPIYATTTSPGENFFGLRDSANTNIIQTHTFSYCNFSDLGSTNPLQGLIIIETFIPNRQLTLNISNSVFDRIQGNGIYVHQLQQNPLTLTLSLTNSQIQGFPNSQSDGILINGTATDFQNSLNAHVILQNCRFTNFGYNQGATQPSLMGSVLRRVGRGKQYTEIIGSIRRDQPAIDHCGNGIFCSDTLVDYSLNIHPPAESPTDSVLFQNLSGSGIYLDMVQLHDNNSPDSIVLSGLAIDSTGFDAIRIGTNWVYPDGTDPNEDGDRNVFISSSRIYNVGALQVNAPAHEANGINFVRGTIMARIENTVIKNVFSNGIKIYDDYEENNIPAGTAARFSCFKFQRISTENLPDPILPAPVWATIQGCGTEFNNQVQHDPSDDQIHGIRLGYFKAANDWPFTTSIHRLTMYDASVANNKGSGIAVRGQGCYQRSNDQNDDNHPRNMANIYNGTMYLTGCSIDDNAQSGIDVLGDKHEIILKSNAQTAQTRTLNSRVRNNQLAGILIRTTANERYNSADSNRIILAGGASEFDSVYFNANQLGSVIFQSDIAGNQVYGFRDNAFKHFGYVTLKGNAGNSQVLEHGIALNSDYAERNDIDIQRTGSIEMLMGGCGNDPVIFRFAGFTKIINHTADGIYICGYMNRAIINSAFILANLHNGIYVDALPLTGRRTDHLGDNYVETNSAQISDNNYNGIWVSSQPNMVATLNFGLDSVVVRNSKFICNNRATDPNERPFARAGIWMNDWHSTLIDTNCIFNGPFQNVGILETGNTASIVVAGGAISGHLSHGIYLDQNAIATSLHLVPYAQFGVLMYPTNVLEGNAGPWIFSNGGSGVRIDETTPPSCHSIYFVAATFQSNARNGVDIASSFTPPDLNRIYVNYCRFINNTDTNFIWSAANGGNPLIMRYNEFIGARGGVYLRTPPTYFERNVVHNPTYFGLKIVDQSNTTQSFIRQNTFLSVSAQVDNVYVDRSTGAGSTTCYGNISQIHSTASTAYKFLNSIPAAFSYCQAWNDLAGITPTWATLVVPSNLPQTTHTVGDAKVLTDVNADNEGFRYHLLWNSAAINAGSTTASTTRDYDGTRGDLGAFGGEGYNSSNPSPTNFNNYREHWRAGSVSIIGTNAQSTSSIKVEGQLKSNTYQTINNWNVPSEGQLDIEAGTVIFQRSRDTVIVKGTLYAHGSSTSTNPYYFNDSVAGWHRFTGGTWKRFNNLRPSFFVNDWPFLRMEQTSSSPRTNYRIKLDNVRRGLTILGSNRQLLDTLRFFQLVIIPDSTEGTTDSIYSGLRIENRPVYIDSLALYRFQNSNGFTRLYGIWLKENLGQVPATRYWQDTWLKVNRLFMNENDAYFHRHYSKYVFCDNTGGNNDGLSPVITPNSDLSSITLIDAKIYGESQYINDISSNASGIHLRQSTFTLTRDTVLNIHHGNALTVELVPLAQSYNKIYYSRFAKSNRYEESTDPNVGNGVLVSDNAMPTFVECSIDSNDQNGILMTGGGSPYLWNIIHHHGNHVFDNAQHPIHYNGDPRRFEYGAAEVFQRAISEEEPAPNMTYNSIFRTHLEDEIPLVRRTNLMLPVAIDHKYNGIWWGTRDTDIIAGKMYGLHPDGEQIHNPVSLFRNRLPFPPDDPMWPYPVNDTTGIEYMARGDFRSASNYFLSLLTDDRGDWSLRANAVPLLFVANRELGWSFDDNMKLLDSLQHRYEGTDMFPVVRNYKPLLALLHSDPKKAYIVYRQFQIAPISFEDSVAAVIAMAILEPVMGPEEKQSSEAMEMVKYVRREDHIDALHQLLYSKTTTTKEFSTIPLKYTLSDPYPNPFNSTIVFQFTLPQAGATQFSIFDALGREVYNHKLGVLSAGKFDARWDGMSATGNKVGSGVYFLKLQSNNYHAIKKVVLLK